MPSRRRAPCPPSADGGAPRVEAARARPGPVRDGIEQEVQHRTRNLLAVVRSVLRRTVAAGGTGEHMVDHFSGRLDALARAHQAGAGRPAGDADLEELVRGELLAFRFGDDPRIAISGPPVAVDARAAPTLGLALHELVTNSIKFGALSEARTGTPPRSGAGVAIGWHVDADGLRIDWTEFNVPIVAPAPRRAGFGREFIEDALPYQLGGAVSFDLVPGGLTCRLAIPLASLRARKDERGWN